MTSTVELFDAIPDSLSFMKSFGTVGVLWAIAAVLLVGGIIQTAIARLKMRYEDEEAEHIAALSERRIASRLW